METFNVQRAEANQQSTSWQLVWRTLGIIIGALFVYAGALKAWDPVRFAGDIENYHILPWWVSVRLAFYLPWLEILCGLALITRRLYAGALALVMALMLVFIATTIAAKVRGLDITCGCFGHASSHLSFAWHLALDLTILAVILGLWRRSGDQLKKHESRSLKAMELSRILARSSRVKLP